LIFWIRDIQPVLKSAQITQKKAWKREKGTKRRWDKFERNCNSIDVNSTAPFIHLYILNRPSTPMNRQLFYSIQLFAVYKKYTSNFKKMCKNTTGNQIKAALGFHITPVRMTIKKRDNKCCQACVWGGTFKHCGGNVT
jgi:hypothetical protein